MLAMCQLLCHYVIVDNRFPKGVAALDDPVDVALAFIRYK